MWYNEKLNIKFFNNKKRLFFKKKKKNQMLTNLGTYSLSGYLPVEYGVIGSTKDEKTMDTTKKYGLYC